MLHKKKNIFQNCWEIIEADDVQFDCYKNTESRISNVPHTFRKYENLVDQDVVPTN